ncbi:MAG: hypothetical protein H6622_08965 [Halobacteriovoraceae bacterium]|nr:hypothetical protein [Halobacteriovoraceae bacterium]
MLRVFFKIFLFLILISGVSANTKDNPNPKYSRKATDVLLSVKHQFPQLLRESSTYKVDLLNLINLESELLLELSRKKEFENYLTERPELVDIKLTSKSNSQILTRIIDTNAFSVLRNTFLNLLNEYNSEDTFPEDLISTIQKELLEIQMSRSSTLLGALYSVASKELKTEVSQIQNNLVKFEKLIESIEEKDYIKLDFQRIGFERKLSKEELHNDFNIRYERELSLSTKVDFLYFTQAHKAHPGKNNFEHLKKLIEQISEAELDFLKDKEEYTKREKALLNVFSLEDKEKKLLKGYIGKYFDRISEKKIEKFENYRDIRLREVPPTLALFRGIGAKDCSSNYSPLFSYSLFERTFFVEDNKDRFIGYVTTTLLDSDHGKTLFVHTITGNKMKAVDVNMILDFFVRNVQFFGAQSVVIPDLELIDQKINFYTLSSIFKEHLSKSIEIQVKSLDREFRELLITDSRFDQSRLYDPTVTRAFEIRHDVISQEGLYDFEVKKGSAFKVHEKWNKQDEKILLLTLLDLAEYEDDVRKLSKVSGFDFRKLEKAHNVLKNEEHLNTKKFMQDISTIFKELGIKEEIYGENSFLLSEGLLNAQDAFNEQNIEMSMEHVKLILKGKEITDGFKYAIENNMQAIMEHPTFVREIDKIYLLDIDNLDFINELFEFLDQDKMISILQRQLEELLHQLNSKQFNSEMLSLIIEFVDNLKKDSDYYLLLIQGIMQQDSFGSKHIQELGGDIIFTFEEWTDYQKIIWNELFNHEKFKPDIMKGFVSSFMSFGDRWSKVTKNRWRQLIGREEFDSKAIISTVEVFLKIQSVWSKDQKNAWRELVGLNKFDSETMRALGKYFIKIKGEWSTDQLIAWEEIIEKSSLEQSIVSTWEYDFRSIRREWSESQKAALVSLVISEKLSTDIIWELAQAFANIKGEWNEDLKKALVALVIPDKLSTYSIRRLAEAFANIKGEWNEDLKKALLALVIPDKLSTDSIEKLAEAFANIKGEWNEDLKNTLASLVIPNKLSTNSVKKLEEAFTNIKGEWNINLKRALVKLVDAGELDYNSLRTLSRAFLNVNGYWGYNLERAFTKLIIPEKIEEHLFEDLAHVLINTKGKWLGDLNKAWEKLINIELLQKEKILTSLFSKVEGDWSVDLKNKFAGLVASREHDPESLYFLIRGFENIKGDWTDDLKKALVSLAKPEELDSGEVITLLKIFAEIQGEWNEDLKKALVRIVKSEKVKDHFQEALLQAFMNTKGDWSEELMGAWRKIYNEFGEDGVYNISHAMSKMKGDLRDEHIKILISFVNREKLSSLDIVYIGRAFLNLKRKWNEDVKTAWDKLIKHKNIDSNKLGNILLNFSFIKGKWSEDQKSAWDKIIKYKKIDRQTFRELFNDIIRNSFKYEEDYKKAFVRIPITKEQNKNMTPMIGAVILNLKDTWDSETKVVWETLINHKNFTGEIIGYWSKYFASYIGNKDKKLALRQLLNHTKLDEKGIILIAESFANSYFKDRDSSKEIWDELLAHNKFNSKVISSFRWNKIKYILERFSNFKKFDLKIIRGAGSMLLYRNYEWDEDHKNTWNELINHKSFDSDAIRNLGKVIAKLDFTENINLEKALISLVIPDKLNRQAIISLKRAFLNIGSKYKWSDDLINSYLQLKIAENRKNVTFKEIKEKKLRNKLLDRYRSYSQYDSKNKCKTGVLFLINNSFKKIIKSIKNIKMNLFKRS